MYNDNSNLLDFWQNETFDNTYIAKPDYDILKQNNMLIKKMSEYDPKNKLLYEDLPCEPFVGDIMNAKIYIVALNPGAKENEHDNWDKKKNPVLFEMWKKNLSQTNEYPFYYLDPALETSGGGKYWVRKDRFGWIITQLTPLFGSAEKARKFIAKNVCDIELCPYHSEEWDEKNNFIINKLPSVKTTINFLRNHVIPDVIQGKKSLIVMRKVKRINDLLSDVSFDYGDTKIKFSDLETLFPDNVAFYKTKDLYRFARLDSSTPGGKILQKQLNKLLG